MDPNEPSGYCVECGEEVDEPHHLYCRDCYAEQQGWTRPDRGVLERQHETREHVSLLRLIERVERLERHVAELIAMVGTISQRLDRIDFDGPLGGRGGSS